jgi:DNA-binding CsgD family transcriptional regulator
MMALEVTRAGAMGPLRGRGAEVESIERWLASVADAGVQVMLVEGEAGIGKSRLLEAARDRAAAQGFTVLDGGCDELERSRPFGPLLAALSARPSAGEFGPEGAARLLAEGAERRMRRLEPTRDADLQFRVVDAAVDHIEEIALRGPVALLLDDLQWADPSTLLTLNSLTRRLGYLRVAVLAAFRAVPRTPALAQLLDALTRGGGRWIVLGPLDAAAVGHVATDLVGAETGRTVAAAIAGAAGNPFYVIELIQAMIAEGAVELVEGRVELVGVSLPPSLRSTIVRRLAFVGEEALDMLRRASVLGSTFSVRDLATVSERPVADLVRTLREPLEAGLLVEAEGRLRFRHDLVRDALSDDLPADARAALHRDVARRLADAGASPLQVAEHLMLGAQPGDLDASSRLLAAARVAGRHAPGIAVELLERSLELAAPSPALRGRVLTDLVPALMWSGRPEEALARAREALLLPPRSGLAGSLRLGLVQALSVLGRYEDLLGEVERSTRATELSADVHAQLLAEAANAALFLGAFDRAEAAAHAAVTTGTPVGSEGAESGLLILSDLARGRGQLSLSLRLAEEALERCERRGKVRRGWRPEIFIAMALRSLDRFGEADETIQRGRRIDEHLGRVSYLPVYGYELATGLFLAGRWREAAAEAEASLALADEVGLAMLRSWPRSVLALMAVHRGDLGAAAAHLGVSTDAPGPDDDARTTGGPPRASLAHALLQEARGDASGALSTLETAWDLSGRGGSHAARAVLGPDLVRLALAAGDGDSARRIATAMEATAREAGVSSLEAAALRCRGLADGDPERLVRAAAAYAHGPRAFDHAVACEDAAVALARTGGLDEARRLFDLAIDHLIAMGADRAAARALAAARSVGIGRRRRGGRARAAYGWRALTTSELEVVRLAADGLTNPEIGRRLFISRRTVQTHLSSAFRKLEITSRVELAAHAARRGGLGDPPDPEP